MNKKQKARLELDNAIKEVGAVGCMDAPDAFFADYDDPNSRYKMRLAKSICGACPIKNICLEYALVSSEKHGVWGGMNRLERESFKRSRSRKVA